MSATTSHDRTHAQTLATYRNARRQIHMDFHTPDDAPGFLSDFSPDDIARTLEQAGVQGAKIFARCSCGNSYYFTQVGKRHPQLRRDFLKETATALRSRGIVCIAHCAILQNWSAYTTHPDWRIVKEDGSHVHEAMCPNSQYIQEIVLPQLVELCDYPLDGFFLDIVDYPADITGCFCEHCRRAFCDATGREWTPELARNELEVNATFRYQSLNRMLESCKAVRDQHAPHMIILANHAHMVVPWAFNHGGDTKDVADVGVAESQPLFATMYQTGQHYCRLLRRKDIPFEIIPVRFMSGWGEGTLKPLAQMNYENALIAANGGVISLGDHLPPDGRLDEKVYERIGLSNAFIAAREPFLRDSQPVPHTAVIQRVDSNYWNRAANGAEQMLDDMHIQADVLDVNSLDHLDDYKVLVLPDRRPNPKGMTNRRDAFIFPIPTLTQAHLEKISAWVKAGGRLIVEGNAIVSESSVAPAEQLLGVRVGKQVATQGYLCADDDAVPACYRNFPLQVRVPFYSVEPTTARPILGWRHPLQLSRTDCTAASKRMPGAKADTAAVFFNRYGRGHVLYFAFPIFLEYSERGWPWIQEVFACLTRDVFCDRPVTIEGHPSLRTNLRKAPGGVWYLDLLFAHTEPIHTFFPEADILSYPVVQEEYALPNVRIFIRDVRPRAITLEPGARPLIWQTQSDGIVFTVPEIRTYDIVKVVERDATH